MDHLNAAKTEPSALAPSPGDMAIVGQLKELWRQHGHHPSVRAAFKFALNDSEVTPMELQVIHATIALAVAHEIGGWEAFLRSGPDPEALAELELAREMSGSDKELAAKVDEVLKDGKVTAEELASLRALMEQSRTIAAAGPATRVRQPPPPRPDMPGRIPVKPEDEDEGD